MNRIHWLCSFILAFAFFSATPSFSQVKFKLQWLGEQHEWGVFITPEEGHNPSQRMVVGSGQVTLVAPTGFMSSNLNFFSGSWSQNALIPAPKENPEKDYISFGFVKDNPPIIIQAGEETLLFTFSAADGQCPDELYLIEEGDPFMVFPNSANANPGNEISIFDIETQTIYQYTENYAPQAWDCHEGKEVEQGPYRPNNQGKRNKRPNRP